MAAIGKIGRSFFQPSLRDFYISDIKPKVETLGYYQESLRDRTDPNRSEPDIARDACATRQCSLPLVGLLQSRARGRGYFTSTSSKAAEYAALQALRAFGSNELAPDPQAGRVLR